MLGEAQETTENNKRKKEHPSLPTIIIFTRNLLRKDGRVEVKRKVGREEGKERKEKGENQTIARITNRELIS